VTHILETERILLREFGEQDAEAFLALNGDPRVMRRTGEPIWTDLEETRRRLRDYPDYRRHGYGRWALVYKPDRMVVGFCGLKYLGELQEVDLGYRLAYDYWGRGLATESSRAVLEYGFETLKLGRIIGLVLPENEASVSVLRKIGMRRTGPIAYLGETPDQWALSAEEWRQGGSGPPSGGKHAKKKP
jgi:RimJ/RimL family protein N-acetyltransferase